MLGAGLPRISDGSFLFLQHMISKMKPVEEGGSRIAIVFNGSPLFTGDAGSGESEIRRWIIENDWLDAIVALPDQMFYNTGISTYIFLYFIISLYFKLLCKIRYRLCFMSKKQFFAKRQFHIDTSGISWIST